MAALLAAAVVLGAGCTAPGPERDTSAAATAPSSEPAFAGDGAAVTPRGTRAPRDVLLATQTALDLARPHADLGAALAPFLAAFEAQPDGAVTTPPRDETPAWHALTVRLPAAADGRRVLGTGNGAGSLLRLSPVGAAPAGGTLHDGRMVYPDAYAATDVIVTASPVRFEELLLLRNASAPTEFDWRVELGGGMAALERDADGGLVLRDQHGAARLRLLRPFAVDARGTRREADLAWDGAVLSLRLDAAGLEYPILVDPAAEAATWNQRSVSGPVTARRGHSLTYDSNRNVSLLFGGYDAAASANYLADLWQWNGSTWTQLCTTAPCSTNPKPPARALHAAAFDPVRRKLVVFGGFYYSGAATYYCDLWEWDSVLQSWSNPRPQATCAGAGQPVARSFAAAAYDGVSVTVYGGWNGTNRFQDTWSWNGAGWTQRCTSGCTPPSPRSGAAMAYDSSRGVVVLFGGTPNGSAYYCDTWEWSGTSGSWTPRLQPTCSADLACTTTGGIPHQRYAASLAYDGSRRRTIMFGGGAGSGATNCGDTWEWNGTVWSLLATAGPAARRLSALSFHAGTAPRRAYLFGGQYSSPAAVYGDTWEYSTLGSGCSVGTDCDSGYCVDSVCCAVSACGQCQRCNGDAPLTGTCTAVVSAPDPGTCDGVQACDAFGVCKKANGQPCPGGATDCAYGKCVEGYCCDSDCAAACMGCAVAGHLGSCWNLDRYAHDTVPSNLCVDGTYKMGCDGSGGCKRDSGELCSNGTADCASGNCVDSVCCGTTCTAPCQGCAVPGHAGTCWNLARYTEDTYPTNACVDGTYQMSCNGSGVCTRDDGEACGTDGTLCSSGNCVDGVCCNTTCTGTCTACNVAGHVGTCWNLERYVEDTSPPSACVDGAYKMSCDGNGACKRDNGEVCGVDGTLCASGVCVDGVCCATTCAANCWSCDVAGSEGTCAKVARYEHDTSCASPNACDGSGNCFSENGQTCSGGGTCASGLCVDNVCCDTACTATCMGCAVSGHAGSCWNLDRYAEDAYPTNACVDGAFKMSCNGGGLCRRDNGEACGTDGTLCASGNCVDGVCCDTTCTGICTACNLASHVGTCWNVDRYAEDTYPTDACVDGAFKMSCNGGGLCRRDNGEACGTDGTLCASGNCVDGVCCDTACMGTCTACTVAGHVGTCWNLDRYAVDLNATSTCTAPHACDGAGHCYNEDGQGCSPGCASGYCVDGVCCATACLATCQACNVAGAAGACANLPVDAEDTYGAAQCIKAENHACDGAGACKAKLGVACGSDGSVCASGHCVDGVCCNGACTATCKACNVAGSEGTCTDIPMNGKDTWPVGTCVAPQGCDGFGACRQENGQPCPNGATDCASNTCVEGVCCDGACTGVCRSCLVAGAVGTCTNLPRFAHDTYPAEACVAPGACDGAGVCKSENGRSCGSDPLACASGNCVDGVCCDTPCTTPCWACNLTPAGSCALLPRNAADSFPGNACVAPSACDGAGACKLALGETCGAATQCASGFCVDNVCCAEACDTPCKVCGTGGVCSNLGVGAEDPVASLPCLKPAGSCDGLGHCKRVRGQSCTTGGDCVSTFCADQVCCDEACGGACRSCDQVGLQGTCSKYPQGTDPELECGSGPCKGACDGVVGCQYPDAATECVPANCTSGSRHEAAQCDGAGGCTPGASSDCAPYECDEGQSQCQATCVDDGDCQHAFWCDGTHCLDDLALQESCARDGQCQSGHCVDGVCCDQACTGDCQYCAYAGTTGTCVTAAVGDDPRRRCQAATGGSEACAGTCDATGQCAFPDVGTRCDQCAACDGTGRCSTVPEDDAQCGMIDCNGLDSACRTYSDLTANRCAALGVCKASNDPATCIVYADLPCADGGSSPTDAAAQLDSGPPPPEQSGGCRAGGGAGHPAAGLLLLLLGLLAARARSTDRRPR